MEFIHRRIVEQRDQGLAVLLISTELDEIYALSDRIAVMYEGRIIGFVPPDVPAEELGLLMAGAGDEQAAAAARAAGGPAPPTAAETGLMGAEMLGIGVPDGNPDDQSSTTETSPPADPAAAGSEAEPE